MYRKYVINLIDIKDKVGFDCVGVFFCIWFFVFCIYVFMYKLVYFGGNDEKFVCVNDVIY